MPWDRIAEIARTYGYGFLFVSCVAENTFLLGLVVPGDTVVVLGGAFLARAELRLDLLLASVILGVLGGSLLSFWIGRRGGTALIARWGPRFGVGPRRVEAAQGYFERHGAKTVFLAAFVSGLKNMIPALAGASQMGFVRFVAYNAPGSILRSVALVGVGYAFGANLPRALGLVQKANSWMIGLAAALVVATYILLRLRKRSRRRQSGATGQDRVDRGAR
jgi:membrane protein DedA with SNARE-associated domain